MARQSPHRLRSFRHDSRSHYETSIMGNKTGKLTHVWISAHTEYGAAERRFKQRQPSNYQIRDPEPCINEFAIPTLVSVDNRRVSFRGSDELVDGDEVVLIKEHHPKSEQNAIEQALPGLTMPKLAGCDIVRAGNLHQLEKTRHETVLQGDV